MKAGRGDCHPERSEGTGFLPAPPQLLVQTNTLIPRWLGMTGRLLIATLRLSFGRDRHFGWLRRCARHGSDAACRAVCGSGCSGSRCLSQSKRLANFGVQPGHHILVVFQELTGVLTALADPL